MQLGNWDDALADVAKFLEQYPDHEEARRLKNQIKLMISLDSAERDDQDSHRKQMITRKIVGASVLLIILVLAYLGFQRIDFASLFYPPPAPTSVIPPELPIAFSNAKTFMAAGQYDEALEFINKVKEIDPSYPGLDDLIEQLDLNQSVDALYEEALNYISNNQDSQAYTVLEKINLLDPLYKDVSILIVNLEKKFELEERLQIANDAYDSANWEEAIINFKSYLAFSQSDDVSSVEEKLFASYIHMIEDLLSEDQVDLDDLKYAGELLQDARKFRAQDSDEQLARSIIENDIRDQLVDNYILLAETELYESPNSIVAMAAAKQYLSTALVLNPHSPAIYLEFDLLSRYLNSLNSFDQNQWTDVIVDMRYIYEKDPGFANGAANQFLFEAYTSRGLFWITVGNFTSAVEDFQQAALLAQQYPDAIIMNYEAQLNLAYAIGQTGNYKDAANLYKSAIESANVKQRAYSMERIFYVAISAAETNLRQRIYERSYYFYLDAVEGKKEVFTLIPHTFVEGDHIVFLAKKHNSSVQMILEYNDLIYTDKINPGQELTIPTLP